MFLCIGCNLLFSLYLELSLSRTNSLVPYEFEIERVNCIYFYYYLSFYTFSHCMVHQYEEEGRNISNLQSGHVTSINYSSRGGGSFISRNIFCTHYSYLANNFSEIMSKRLCIKKSHNGHLKHSRKDKIRNFNFEFNQQLLAVNLERHDLV